MPYEKGRKCVFGQSLLAMSKLDPVCQRANVPSKRSPQPFKAGAN